MVKEKGNDIKTGDILDMVDPLLLQGSTKIFKNSRKFQNPKLKIALCRQLFT